MAILQRSSEFVLQQPCIQDQFTMRWAYLKNRIKIPCITIITCCQFPTDFSCNSIYKINSTRLFDENEIIGMIIDMMFQIVLILVQKRFKVCIIRFWGCFMLYFRVYIVGAMGTLLFSSAFSFLLTDFILHYLLKFAYNLLIIWP